MAITIIVIATFLCRFFQMPDHLQKVNSVAGKAAEGFSKPR